MSENQNPPKTKKQILVEYAVIWGPIFLGSLIIAIEMKLFK